MAKLSKGKIGSIVGMSVIFTFLVALNIGCFVMKDVLNTWAVITKTVASEEETQNLLKAGKDLAEKIEEEGIVLAKNNGTLPLNKDTTNKVNVFGWSSVSWIRGGSGSGRVTGSPNERLDFYDALNDYGIETNDELKNMYLKFCDSRPNDVPDGDTLHKYPAQYSRLLEPSIENTIYYKESVLDNALDFSDTAFVVLGRVSGESNDSPKHQYRYNRGPASSPVKNDDTGTYLDISEEEDELLDYVSNNYKNTIVIVNAVSPLNLEFLTRYSGIDACISVGGTGEKDTGVKAIPKILWGEVNPSGRFTDTYAYNFESSPAYHHSSADDLKGQWGVYKNSKGYYPYNGTTNGNLDGSPAYTGVYYTDYAEDIYVGYKWYETADAEGIFDSVDNIYGKGYEGVVQFPFGWGQSYTTFEQKVVSVSKPRGSNLSLNDEIEVTVEVKNTGKVKGQDVVQLYLTRPYTKGGIEKSYVELVDFNKTMVLDPGATELLKVKVAVDDFKSYDCYDKNQNGFKGYEIEAGEYQLKVMKNSHEMIDDPSGLIKFNIADDLLVKNDKDTGAEVKNRFLETSSDGVAIDGSDSNQEITYLTRANFKGTFATEYQENRVFDDSLKDTNLYKAEDAKAFIKENDPEIKTGVNKGLKVYDEKSHEVTPLGLELGEDFNSEKWDEVLDQVTIEEMKDTTLHGYTGNRAISSIGKPKTREVDGPNQVGSFNVADKGTGFPNSVTLAQTFNKTLAYKFGLQMGKEANFKGYNGLYAPGINLHRTAFGGRNYEYYSEDSYLTGIMGSHMIKGCLNVGTYVYVKHLIAYDQETMRDSLYTWMTEQALREVYLKPFKMVIEIGGCSGIMTSYNRLGATWAGGNIDLIDGVLKQEWGYKGAILTDYSDHREFMNMDQALRAGGTLWMDGWDSSGKYRFEQTSNTFKNCLREATKRNVYTFLNAAYRLKYFQENGDEGFIPTHTTDPIYYWKYILYGVDALGAAGLLTWGLLAFLPRKKKELSEETSEELLEK